MSSEEYFTANDLVKYTVLSEEILVDLTNMLNEYCLEKNITYILADRIKSMKSINDKIQKRKLEKEKKGEEFIPKLDLMDIIGLRIIFCDKKNHVDNIKKLNQNIHEWNKDQFLYEFELSKLYENNYNIEHVFGFLDFLQQRMNNIIIIKDYIQNPKETGYQSLHVILAVPDPDALENSNEIDKYMTFEIQIRNYIQHLYNEKEHDRYKPGVDGIVEDYDDVFDYCSSTLRQISEDYFKTKKYQK